MNSLYHLLDRGEQKSTMGFYFHIPFCSHICPYCDFIKTAKFNRNSIDIYFQSLHKQLDFFLDLFDFSSHPWATLYVGGGTPGLFDPAYYAPLVEKLTRHFKLEEVTLETNPLNLSLKRLRGFRSIGFDRLTIGAQSLDPLILNKLGRKHSPQMVLEHLKMAQEAQFKKIQVDLIYGLRRDLNHTPLVEQISNLVSHGASGISAYALTIEERTLFAQDNWTDEGVAQEEYSEIYHCCINNGFHQVETSNFSQFPTYHNNLYWYGYPYIGIGTGAHGLLPPTLTNPWGQRYAVGLSSIPHEWGPGNDRLEYDHSVRERYLWAIEYEEKRTLSHYIEEMIFLLLRTPLGVPFSFLLECLKKFNPEISLSISLIKDIIGKNPLIMRGLGEGLLIFDDNSFKVAPLEKIRGDRWALELIKCVEEMTKDSQPR